MQKAVDNLEALFEKAETDLTFLSRKLQMENGQALKEENNPIKLMTAIEEVKTEYSALVKDISAIQTAQKDAVDFFKSSLTTMTQLLDKLDTQSEGSTELAESTKTMYEELSELLGVPVVNLITLPSHQTDDQRLPTQDEVSGAHAVATSKESASLARQPGTDIGKCQQKESNSYQLSASERRVNTQDFIEITSEEFQTVSELVRGKVKLDDLNRTYKLLWQHFKEQGKKESLSPQQMNSMGLRVSGATGEAKLKVLRSLKLCQINKNGEVKLS
uniref:Protein FAM33A n=1 Tax=Arion vulgaris TaxID=1028688 RepID=A0A0B7AJ06_9EUPU